MTIDALLRDWAGRWGELPAVLGGDAALTFAALDAAADAWAAALTGAGCAAGSRVALWAANQPAWLAAAFGVWRSGATLVPISTFVTERELADIVAHADVDAIIAQSRMGCLLYTSPSPRD